MLLELAKLRENLKSLMDPSLLRELAELLNCLGVDDSSFISRYKFWIEKNGKDCRYAAMAKQFFEHDNAERVAEKIIEIYHNWAKYYEKKEN